MANRKKRNQTSDTEMSDAEWQDWLEILIYGQTPPSIKKSIKQTREALRNKFKKQVEKLQEDLRSAQETITTQEYTIQELQDEIECLKDDKRNLRKGIDYL